MKEFVYHISEEEKDILILNKIISNRGNFVIFTKNKKSIINLMNLLKRFSISYSYLLETFSLTPLKNFNEGKSRVVFISDSHLKKKIYVNSVSQIIHYDIPDHPLIYNERNKIIKNQEEIKYIQLYCLEKEYQNLKAIEINNDIKITLGMIHKNDLKMPQKPQREFKKTKSYKKQEQVAKYEKREDIITKKKEEKISLWQKIKNFITKLWNSK